MEGRGEHYQQSWERSALKSDWLVVGLEGRAVVATRILWEFQDFKPWDKSFFSIFGVRPIRMRQNVRIEGSALFPKEGKLESVVDSL